MCSREHPDKQIDKDALSTKASRGSNVRRVQRLFFSAAPFESLVGSHFSLLNLCSAS